MDTDQITSRDVELAKVKASIFNAVISSGSLQQKEKSLEISKNAYEWCTDHIAQPAKADARPSGKR